MTRTITIIILSILSTLTAVASPRRTNTTSLDELYERANQFFIAEEYPDALELYLETLRRAEEVHDFKTVSSCTGNIGLIFSIINDYERGAYYTRKTLDLATKNNETDKQRRAAALLTELYVNLNNTDSAQYYNDLQKSIPGSENPENNYLSFYNDGLISEAKGNISLAIFYYNKALDYATSHNLPTKYIIQQLAEIGKMNLTNHRIEDAMKYLSQAEHLADSINSPNMLLTIYRLLQQSYTEQGDSAKAAIYKAKYAATSDTIIDKIRFNAAKNSLYEYENEQTGRQIIGLNQRLDTYIFAIISITIILLLIILLFIITARNNRKMQSVQRILIEKNNQLIQQNEKTARLRNSYLEAIGQIEESTDRSRYKAGISERQLEEMIKKITDTLQDTETISNPQFNLNTLVSIVDSNSTYVSWVINETFGKTFKALLNEYRVKEAAKRLIDDENYGHMTIQAIYESVGYNSASNFIKAFKTVIGMTPSAYQKLQRHPTPDE